MKQDYMEEVKALVVNEDYKNLGTVVLRLEELEHFSNTESVPARIALDCEQIAKLGINEDDYIYIREV